ncbi:hypothetical protein BGZ92_004810, partial [Podila epicladia]
YTERIIQVLKDMDSDANLILEFTDDLKCYVAFKHMDLEQNTDIGQIEIWLLRDWINEDIDHCDALWSNLDLAFVNQHVR